MCVCVREREREREREARLLHKAQSISQSNCLSHDVDISAYMSFHQALLALLLTSHRHENFQLHDPRKTKQTTKNKTEKQQQQNRDGYENIKETCLRCGFYFDKNNIA